MPYWPGLYDAIPEESLFFETKTGTVHVRRHDSAPVGIVSLEGAAALDEQMGPVRSRCGRSFRRGVAWDQQIWEISAFADDRLCASCAEERNALFEHPTTIEDL